MKKNKDIKPRNNKEQAHGYWEIYRCDGTLCYKGYFVNDEESGYEEFYTINNNELQLYYHL